MVDLGLYMVVFGVLGARLLSVLADGYFVDFVNLCADPTQVNALDARVAYCEHSAQCGFDYWCDLATHDCTPPRDCLAWIKVWEGGLAYYGGFLFAMPVGLWYARRKQLGVWRVADLTAPLIAFGLFFGRMGCFLNGCCFGRPTTLPWGVDFPQDDRLLPVPAGLPWGVPFRVPDLPQGHVPGPPAHARGALGSLVLFALLYFVIRPQKRREGQVFAWLLVLYGAMRIVLELWRADDRGIVLGVSTSQWLSLPLIAWGAWILWKTGRVVRDADAKVAAARPPG